MKCFITKDGFGIRGSSPNDLEAIDNLKPGEYRAEITQPRNLLFHKKHFALMKYAYGQQHVYLTFESFRDAVKIKMGHIHIIQFKLGTVLGKDNNTLREQACSAVTKAFKEIKGEGMGNDKIVEYGRNLYKTIHDLLTTNEELSEELDGVDYLAVRPRSISFASMDETQFKEFYSRTIDILISDFCPGHTPEEMDEQAKKYLEFV